MPNRSHNPSHDTVRPIRVPAGDETHQQRLDRLQKQVDELQNQLRRAQRLATVGTMAAMVAHEFNNILTPVINYAQLAQKNPDLKDKAVDRAADGGKRATTICNAILRLAGDEPSQAVASNVKEMALDALAVIGRDFARDRIQLDLDIPEDLEVLAQPVQIEQALVNLILNARRAVLSTTGTRRITIAARHEGQEVAISVADNGPGIDPGIHEQIFHPFFTTCNNCAGGGGSGLGLAICRDIAESAGGSIDVQSAPGRGAVFTLRLLA